MTVDLEIGKKYLKQDIELLFNTNFGSRIKGITLRKWSDKTPYIILFSRSEGPYGDIIKDDTFFYDGEGLEGNQKLTTANKALINSNIEGRIIYGFLQNKSGEGWEYIGLLKVIDYEYVEKDNRKIYEFKLQKEGIDFPDTVAKEFEEIIRISDYSEPQLTIKPEESIVKRKKRSVVFANRIKEIYNNTCAICQKRRFTSSNYPEVESAHIYPKEKDGSDDLRNGISLCKLHHWAFDAGLMSLDDNLNVLIRENIKFDENYREIYEYEEVKIKLPEPVKYSPHLLFVKAHRSVHGFS